MWYGDLIFVATCQYFLYKISHYYLFICDIESYILINATESWLQALSECLGGSKNLTGSYPYA